MFKAIARVQCVKRAHDGKHSPASAQNADCIAICVRITRSICAIIVTISCKDIKQVLDTIQNHVIDSEMSNTSWNLFVHCALFLKFNMYRRY